MSMLRCTLTQMRRSDNVVGNMVADSDRKERNEGMATVLKRRFDAPDQVREFPKSGIGITKLDGHTFMCSTFEPGWRWSEHVKPVAKTEYCEVPHVAYIVSGRMHIRMADGTEEEFSEGDLVVFPGGYDAWIVGDEVCRTLDIVPKSLEQTSGAAKEHPKVPETHWAKAQ